MTVLEITIPGRPITKKNGQVIIFNRARGKPSVKPSGQFEDYQKRAGQYLVGKNKMLNGRYNLKVLYYMPTRQRVDLDNLLAATCDILVHFGVLADDNSDIVAAHDGCRVIKGSPEPRAEITITEIGGE